MSTLNFAVNPTLAPPPEVRLAPITALLADDHPLIVEGLAASLTRFGIQILGHTGVAKEVLGKYAALRPDVVVLDVRFGDQQSGLEVARELLEQHPSARVVFYSQFDQDEIIYEAYRIGGVGFVTKSKAAAVLAHAIETVATTGQPYFLTEIAERIALLGIRQSTKREASPLASLDARELLVFRQMAQGRTNAEIAESMALSPKTISMTSQAIKDKLGVNRPAEITLLAVKCGVVVP